MLIVGDIHFKTKRPKSRIDKDWIDTQLKKFDYICSISGGKILCTGDVFDSPVVTSATIKFTLDLDAILKQRNCTLYTVVGNHDIYSYNMDTLRISNLGIFEKISNNVVVLLHEITLDDYTVIPMNYTAGIDKMVDYTVEHRDSIVVAHSMLTIGIRPYDHTVIDNVKTNARLVISGHCHTGFCATVIGGTTFVNPGSLTRLSISEQGRRVKVLQLNDWKLTEIDVPTEANFIDEVKEQKEAVTAEQFYELLNYSTTVSVHELLAECENKAAVSLILGRLEEMISK